MGSKPFFSFFFLFLFFFFFLMLRGADGGGNLGSGSPCLPHGSSANAIIVSVLVEHQRWASV